MSRRLEDSSKNPLMCTGKPVIVLSGSKQYGFPAHGWPSIETPSSSQPIGAATPDHGRGCRPCDFASGSLQSSSARPPPIDCATSHLQLRLGPSSPLRTPTDSNELLSICSRARKSFLAAATSWCSRWRSGGLPVACSCTLTRQSCSGAASPARHTPTSTVWMWVRKRQSSGS
eukprot:scaffold91652_cov38-Phaeocystis_antarctica.AAC.2